MYMEKMNGKGDPSEIEREVPAAEAVQPAEAEEGSRAEQADVAALEAELQKTKEELQKAKDECDAEIERLARMQAEFDNARRRAQREQQDYREYALADAVKTLLPILDSFDRALASNADGPDFRSGVELVDRQLHDALGKLGVAEVEAVGQPFDPNVHQAIEMVDTAEAEDNHVFEELQRGYMLKGRLLRPAMVRVARNVAAGEE
jgi:molecular chaperone GrpE